MSLKVRVHKFEFNLSEVWCSEEELKHLGTNHIKQLFKEDILSFIEEMDFDKFLGSCELFWEDEKTEYDKSINKLTYEIGHAINKSETKK
jgi:hypothetical protein